MTVEEYLYSPDDNGTGGYVIPHRIMLPPIFEINGKNAEEKFIPFLKHRKTSVEIIGKTKKLIQQAIFLNTEEMLHNADTNFTEYVINGIRNQLGDEFLYKEVFSVIEKVYADFSLRHKTQMSGKSSHRSEVK